MGDLRLSRERTGATHWDLYRGADSPHAFMELYSPSRAGKSICASTGSGSRAPTTNSATPRPGSPTRLHWLATTSPRPSRRRRSSLLSVTRTGTSRSRSPHLGPRSSRLRLHCHWWSSRMSGRRRSHQTMRTTP